MTGPVLGFFRLASAYPDRRALISDAGTVTFGELGRRVNQVSRALLTRGLRPGDRIVAVVHNGPEYFELALATAQAGLVLVPVNWHLSPDEQRYIIQDSAAKLLVADTIQATALPLTGLPAHRHVIGDAVPGWQPYADLGADESTEPPDNRPAGTLMLYTSGTTGHPKGVHKPLPESDADTAARDYAGTPVRYGLTPGPGMHLVVAPLYHAAPGAHALGFLHSGSTVVIHPRFDAELTLRDIERFRINTVHLVPTHFHRMLRLPDQVRDGYDLASLHAVIHAGAPCPVPVKQAMIDWLGPIIWEYLGSTEGLVSVVDTPQWLTKPGTLGRAVPGVTIQIINDGAEAPVGEPGTIYFGTPGRPPAFEYLHDPAKTAANRHGDLATAGDYGYLDEDGYLFLLDRRTDLIISGGVNIYPAEIEQQLILHPAVNDVAVIGLPDPEWGQQVLAVVQPTPEAPAGAELAAQLAEYCAEHLAAFKHPRRFEFVTEFPRTETGKVQRHRLRDTYT